MESPPCPRESHGFPRTESLIRPGTDTNDCGAAQAGTAPRGGKGRSQLLVFLTTALSNRGAHLGSGHQPDPTQPLEGGCSWAPNICSATPEHRRRMHPRVWGSHHGCPRSFTPGWAIPALSLISWHRQQEKLWSLAGSDIPIPHLITQQATSKSELHSRVPATPLSNISYPTENKAGEQRLTAVEQLPHFNAKVRVTFVCCRAFSTLLGSLRPLTMVCCLPSSSLSTSFSCCRHSTYSRLGWLSVSGTV